MNTRRGLRRTAWAAVALILLVSCDHKEPPLPTMISLTIKLPFDRTTVFAGETVPLLMRIDGRPVCDNDSRAEDYRWEADVGAFDSMGCEPVYRAPTNVFADTPIGIRGFYGGTEVQIMLLLRSPAALAYHFVVDTSVRMTRVVSGVRLLDKVKSIIEETDAKLPAQFQTGLRTFGGEEAPESCEVLTPLAMNFAARQTNDPRLLQLLVALVPGESDTAPLRSAVIQAMGDIPTGVVGLGRYTILVLAGGPNTCEEVPQIDLGPLREATEGGLITELIVVGEGVAAESPHWQADYGWLKKVAEVTHVQLTVCPPDCPGGAEDVDSLIQLIIQSG
jgi:hypothetical protein